MDSQKSEGQTGTSGADSKKAAIESPRTKLFYALQAKPLRPKVVRAICNRLTPDSLQEPWGQGICKDHPTQGPLHQALYRFADPTEEGRHRHVKVLKTLLEAGATAPHDPCEESPIEIAVHELDGELQDEVVGLLMKHGARFPTWATRGGTLADQPICKLTKASRRLYDKTWAKDRKLPEYAQKGDAKAVKALLEKGCHPDLRDTEGTGETALAIAIGAGHIEVVKTLLRYKASVTQADGPPALLLAVDTDEPDLKIVRALLHADANPLERTSDERLPLGVAAKKTGGKSELVQLLTKHIYKRQAKRLRSLRDAGAASLEDKELEEEKESQIKAKLLQALGEDKPDARAIQRLAKALGSALDYPLTEGGPSALWLAVQKGDTRTVRAVLNVGADPNVVLSPSGETAFHVALENLRGAKLDQMIELLLEHGAWVPSYELPDLTEDMSRSCVDLLLGQCMVDEAFRKGAEEGDTKAVKRYLKNGFPVDLVDYDNRRGRTALIDACAGGHTKVVQILLKAGASLSFRDRYEECAMDVAKTEEIRELLKQYEEQDASDASSSS